MDVVNWWLNWPTWLQDLSVVLLVVIFLSQRRALRGGPAVRGRTRADVEV